MGALRIAVLATSLAACHAGRGTAQSFLRSSNPVANIDIRNDGRPVVIEYRAGVRCTFARTAIFEGRRSPVHLFEIETRAVRDRILITHRKPEGDSSILLTHSGEPREWNVPSRGGGRVSRQAGDVAAFWFDAPTFLHPSFGTTPGRPESFYGRVLGPDGRQVAQLLYRGRTIVSRRSAFVFDVMNLDRSASMPNGGAMGRLILDEEDRLPHALVLGFNHRIQYERRSCLLPRE
jgi:hypothetical protein